MGMKPSSRTTILSGLLVFTFSTSSVAFVLTPSNSRCLLSRIPENHSFLCPLLRLHGEKPTLRGKASGSRYQERDALLEKHIAPILEAASVEAVARGLVNARNSISEDSRQHSNLLRLLATSLERVTHLRPPSLWNGKIDATVDESTDDTTYREILGDILQSIEMLCDETEFGVKDIASLAEIVVCCSILFTYSPPLARTLRPTAAVAWRHLSGMDVTQRLYPNRWFDLLRACKVLELETELTVNQDSLSSRLLHRLCRGDALGRLSTSRLVVALRTFDSLDPLAESSNEMFLKCVVRRLKKQKVRDGLNTAQLIKAVTWCSRLLRWETLNRRQTEQTFHSESTAVLKSPEYSFSVEVHSLLYKLCQAFLYRPEVSGERSATMIIAVMKSASFLHDSSQILEHGLCKNLESALMSNSVDLDTYDIVKALQALDKWRNSSHPALVQLLGQQFLARTKEGTMDLSRANAVLRCAVLLHRNDTDIMQPYCQAASSLLTNDKFLRQSSDLDDLSNLLWFFNSAKYFDHDAMLSICDRLVEIQSAQIELSTTPRVACRVIRALTETTSWTQKNAGWSQKLQDVLYRLFDILGESLLSFRVTPSEVSDAMASYARAAYTNDLGIFDHLASLMAENTDQYTTRQLVVGLWSCAKFYSYERSNTVEEEAFPKYLSSSVGLLTEDIVQRVDSLNAKDTSQVIYALGVLDYNEEENVCVIAQHAKKHCMDFQGQEIANVIWGLGKVGGKSYYDVVFNLIRRVEKDDSLILSPQESSNILYALGRLDLRDEAVFTKLCNSILDQIESASAQSVANVLWASRAVHFKPPQKLLDTWATEKLGLAVELDD